MAGQGREEVHKQIHEESMEMPQEGAKMASAGEGDGQEAVRLKELLMVAQSWGPAFEDMYGKQVEDFTVTDVNGKTFTLSEQRGKDVMVIFFATWCGPCRQEVPHLKALRKEIGESELAMVAISNESQSVVAPFAKSNKINYQVASASSKDLPRPINSVQYLPTAFFLDGEGRLKLASVGMMPEEQMKLALRLE